MLKRYPHELLMGPRIELRKHELAVARDMFRLVDSDRQRLGCFLPWVAGMHAVQDEEEYICFARVEWEEFRFFDYGIFVGGAYVGNCGVHHLSWENERCELGYWIAGSHEGQGYMAEAVRVLEAELRRLGFHRIEIRCDPANARSAAVPARCGFAHEATLRDHKLERGRRRDTMLWVKLG